MGDANKRGPYEVRVQQSVARKAAKIEKKHAAAQAWWEGLTEEQRQEEKKKAKEARDARLTLLGIVGLVAPVLP